MNRLWVRLSAGLVAAVSVTVISSACAHDNSSFFLQSVLAPPQGGSSGGCVFTGDPTQPQLFNGVLDVEAVKDFDDVYHAVFLAADQLIPQGNQALLLTETSRINITKAVVTITDTSNVQLANYTTLGSGFVNPASGTTPGYGTVEFDIVDPTTIKTLRSKLGWLERETIITNTKAIGVTLGNDTIESNTFQFPITVCRGCLIGFDTDLAATPIPNCYVDEAASSATAAICFYGQDEAFDCHACITDPYCLCGQATCTGVPPPVDAGTDALAE